MSEFDFKNGFNPDGSQPVPEAPKAEPTSPEANAASGSSEPVGNYGAPYTNGGTESVFSSAADSIERSVNPPANEGEKPFADKTDAHTPTGEYTYAFKGDSLPHSDGVEVPRPSQSGAYGNQGQYAPYTRPAGAEANRGASQNGTSFTGSYSQGAPSGYGQNGGYGQQNSAYSNGAPSGNNGAAYGGYRPPYSNGGASPYTSTARPEPPRPPYTAAPENKPPKKNGSLKTSTAILLCVACVLLSFVSGILGSALINEASKVDLDKYELAEGDTENGGVAGITEDGAVVLYRSVETVKEDGSDMTVAEVANTVSDSVVEITTEFVTTDNFFFGQYVSEGAGSGVIISEDGYIITNNHVISDASSGDTASKITVRLRSGEEYEAKLVGKDADSDVAVLKINADNLKAAVWGDSDKLVVGQQVIAVGNPLGELGGTVTTGIISGSDREVQIDNVVMTLIQIDAAVNPGNSGGGLFNTKGELIGIVNAKSSGSGIEGLGFAIPSNDAYDITTQLLEHGYVRGKVYLGLSFYEANSGYYSSDADSILYVYATEPGYNDDVLESRDIILSIDGEEVSTTAEVKAILKKHQVGDTLTFSILRGKEPMEVEVTCYEAKPIGSVSLDD